MSVNTHIDKINNKIVGQDKLVKKSVNSKIKYDIRFHLYPGLSAVKTIGGNTLLIQINKNKALLFSTNEKNLKIEKSIFFGGQKVLNNYCIVISDIMENNEKIIDWEIIKKMESKDLSFRKIKLTRNFGHQAAIFAGLENFNEDFVIILDNPAP